MGRQLRRVRVGRRQSGAGAGRGILSWHLLPTDWQSAPVMAANGCVSWQAWAKARRGRLRVGWHARQVACPSAACPSGEAGVLRRQQPIGRSLRPRDVGQTTGARERAAWHKKSCWGRPREWGRGREPESGSSRRGSEEIRTAHAAERRAGARDWGKRSARGLTGGPWCLIGCGNG
jgi:hypothetical protein